ncbi:hypothetical protein DL546_006313 [Coniochaeta pulveracea]|uniref:Uncharacterized protein n=1 Tax=Coniochaeta pulveracea TaxID=177199 RepID=A0A420YKX7_9PEZI|nr:hypothetical protein DL546_006313 [Coniochaeta pulveracea]
MSFLGAKAQALGNCTSCLARQLSLATASRAHLLPGSLRLATTAAKSRSKTSPAAIPEVASVPKKRLSTKTATVAAPVKRPRKKKAEAVDDALAPETATPVVVKKTTRAASTKSAAKKKTEPVTEEAEVKPKRTRKAATAASSTKPAVATPRFTKASEIPKANEPAVEPTQQDKPQTMWEVPEAIADSMIEEAQGTKSSNKEPEADMPKKSDPSCPEYKQASRRYVSVMVALPILLVTSYFLFDRLALGNPPKSLEDYRVPPVEKDGKRHPPSL